MADEPSSPGHERHCFVVMPFGREPQEQKWFKGWYEVVIRPAVIEAGFEPKLAATEEEPGAINDEIRAHLALDPMVVVDLAGIEPDDDPNPNVMYELGIRHALGLPLVMLAWKGQSLPFDVSNQRVIMEGRDLIDLETNRRRIVSFINAAVQGRYYKPMDAVSRIATIAAATASLGEDSLLRALTQEIRELRTTVSSATTNHGPRRITPTAPTIKKLTKNTSFRKELYPHFIASGGHPVTWSKILRAPLPSESVEEMRKWSGEQWKDYIGRRAKERDPSDDLLTGAEGMGDGNLDEAEIARVFAALPSQPWPTGIHREVADRLSMTPAMVSDCIKELIQRGKFMKQVNGELFPNPPDANAPVADESRD